MRENPTDNLGTLANLLSFSASHEPDLRIALAPEQDGIKLEQKGKIDGVLLPLVGSYFSLSLACVRQHKERIIEILTYILHA
jgi:hypothetical protein